MFFCSWLGLVSHDSSSQQLIPSRFLLSSNYIYLSCLIWSLLMSSSAAHIHTHYHYHACVNCFYYFVHPQCSWISHWQVRSSALPPGGVGPMPSWRRFYQETWRGSVTRRAAHRRRHQRSSRPERRRWGQALRFKMRVWKSACVVSFLTTRGQNICF